MDLTDARSYQLFKDEKRIGLALANVRTPDQVVAFVRQFGLLESSSEPQREALRKGHRSDEPHPLGRSFVKYHPLPPAREPVTTFLTEAATLREVIDVLHAVRRAAKGDADALVYLRTKAPGYADPLVPWYASSLAAEELAIRLAHTMPYISEHTVFGDDEDDMRATGYLRFAVLPTTLLQACYLDVALRLAEKEPIARCPACARVFVVEDARQKFCTPACASRVRFQRYIKNKPRKGRTTHAHATTRTRRRQRQPTR